MYAFTEETNPIAKKANIAVRANLDICGRV